MLGLHFALPHMVISVMGTYGNAVLEKICTSRDCSDDMWSDFCLFHEVPKNPFPLYK